MAINREALVEKVTRAGELPAYGLVPPVIPVQASGPAVHRPDLRGPAGRGAPTVRRGRLQPGSAADPGTAVQHQRQQPEDRQRHHRHVQDAFGKALLVNPVNVERTEYLQRRARRQFQVVRAAWIGDYADPTVFLNLMLSHAAPPRNDPGFKSAAYDELLEKAGATADSAERSDLLQQAERLLLNEYAIIPIYHFAPSRWSASGSSDWRSISGTFT